MNPSAHSNSSDRGGKSMDKQAKTKKPTQTATEQTCANCGMQQDEWRTTQGFKQDGETFCCEGCASGTGCTC